jgi:arylformamidase
MARAPEAGRKERGAMSPEDSRMTWPGSDKPVRLVDCSQPWNADTPPFPADEPPTVVWAKRLSSHGTNHQRISTQLHIGTHIDAPLHWREEGMDIASIPLERLYGPAVVADLSDVVSDFSIIRPADIEAKVDVKPGDVLIIYTGYNRYYSGGSEPDLVRYFFKRPGADGELADWLVSKQIRWLGVDSSSPDHPMNSNTRDWWPQVYEEAEAVMGLSPKERFPVQNQTICHVRLFQHNIPIVENLNSNVQQLTGRSAHICAFPWKFAGGEAALVRVVGFTDPE